MSTSGDPGQPGQAGQEGKPPGGTGGRGGRGGVGRQGRRGLPGRTSFLPIIGFLILAVGVVLGLRRQGEVSQNNKAFIVCMSAWANQTAARSSILNPQSLERQDKLDKVIRDFAMAQSRDPKVRARLRVTFFRDVDAYIEASDEYAKSVKSNPLPESPRFACGNGEENDRP